MTKDIDFCPHCWKVTNVEPTQKVTSTEIIRGESIKVEDKFLICLECGNEFEDPAFIRKDKTQKDVLKAANEKYRSIHGMLSPREIKKWRQKYDLTQREVGALLSWDHAGLSRYENGALQSAPHDKMLRLVMQPQNLLLLVLWYEKSIREKKRVKLIETLKLEIQAQYNDKNHP
jgi:putative zinc finger/helix-turn-helix YgiT family protein